MNARISPAGATAMRPKTQGLVAAPFTPMRSDGSLNLALVPDYAAWLRSNGIAGAFVGGTTGEGMSLTVEERLQLADAWRRAATASLRVIVHVGHTALSDCRRMAAHAEAIGADGIACLAPFFFRPERLVELVSWCEAVASAAPSVPFYFYHMPSTTGVDFPMAEFIAEASQRIPTLAGVKFTFEDLADFRRTVEFDNKSFDVLFGRDELLLSGLRAGAQAAVGSTYNFAAPLYLDIIRSFAAGDVKRAEERQHTAVRMIDAAAHAGGSPIANFKALMTVLGLDCGPVRPPLRSPTSSQLADLLATLRNLGFEGFCCRRATSLSKA
jgi:N-acetylneuraminate lyase